MGLKSCLCALSSPRKQDNVGPNLQKDNSFHCTNHLIRRRLQRVSLHFLSGNKQHIPSSDLLNTNINSGSAAAGLINLVSAYNTAFHIHIPLRFLRDCMHRDIITPHSLKNTHFSLLSIFKASYDALLPEWKSVERFCRQMSAFLKQSAIKWPPRTLVDFQKARPVYLYVIRHVKKALRK